MGIALDQLQIFKNMKPTNWFFITFLALILFVTIPIGIADQIVSDDANVLGNQFQSQNKTPNCEPPKQLIQKRTKSGEIIIKCKNLNKRPRT